MDLFVGEPRSSVHSEQVVELLSGAARLFLQLSSCTVAGILPRVESAGRNFIQISVRSVPVLPDQENLWILSARITEEGNDRACPGMPDHFELAGGLVWKPHDVDIERDDLSRIHPSRFYATWRGFFFHYDSCTCTSPASSSPTEPRITPASPTTTVCSSLGCRWSLAA